MPPIILCFRRGLWWRPRSPWLGILRTSGYLLYLNYINLRVNNSRYAKPRSHPALFTLNTVVALTISLHERLLVRLAVGVGVSVAMVRVLGVVRAILQLQPRGYTEVQRGLHFHVGRHSTERGARTRVAYYQRAHTDSDVSHIASTARLASGAPCPTDSLSDRASPPALGCLRPATPPPPATCTDVWKVKTRNRNIFTADIYGPMAFTGASNFEVGKYVGLVVYSMAYRKRGGPPGPALTQTPKIWKMFENLSTYFPPIFGESLPIYCRIFDRYFVIKSSF